uniref:Dynein light chain n=1 Tax=Macrostomum lignano TaxID=282301 RepID=A0A1I8ITJ5_9PLAT
MNTSVMDVDSSDEARARPRVNGGLLAQHQGACVCLLGRVVSCPSPTCLLLEASDSVQHLVQLDRGCSENFDMDMYNKAVQICNKFSQAYYTKP